MARGMHKGPRGEKKSLEASSLGKRLASFGDGKAGSAKTEMHKPGSYKK